MLLNLPEWEHSEWSVWLVWLFLDHGQAPEVIVEDIDEGRAGQEVFVVLDGADIIEDKTSIYRVEVTEDAGKGKKE